MAIVLSLRNLLDARLHPRCWMIFLLSFMLVRGLLVLCVLPALEGWDEFQHLGYIDYLDRHGAQPVIGEAFLDGPFVAAIAAYPQSPRGLSSGASTYAEYWSGPTTQPRPALLPRIPLYEAQHPPGYYWLMLPLYRAMGGVSNLVATVFTLRMINLLLTLAAAGIFMASFRLLLGEGLAWRWAASLLAVHPLFLLTGDRVANDALSLLMASLVLYFAVRFLRTTKRDGRERWRLAVMLGVAMGLAAWTKPTILPIIPVAAAAPLLARWRTASTRARRRCAACIALALTLFTIIALPHFTRNLRLYHAAVPIVEAVERGDTRTASDYLAAFTTTDWTLRLRQWWFSGSLWFGGWSFLIVSNRIRVYLFEPLIAGGLLLAVVRAFRERRQPRAHLAAPAIMIGLGICITFTAALAVHAVKTNAYIHLVATCPWYAAAAWPLELLTVAAGFAIFARRWIGKLLAIFLVTVCMVAELVGTLRIMPAAYASTFDPPTAFARLATLRPALLGTPTLALLASAYLVMGSLLVLTLAATTEAATCLPSVGHPFPSAAQRISRASRASPAMSSPSPSPAS